MSKKNAWFVGFSTLEHHAVLDFPIITMLRSTFRLVSPPRSGPEVLSLNKNSSKKVYIW